MTVVDINEAKSCLSKYLQLVEQGETVIICKRNIPIAEIKAVNHYKHKRKLGFANGQGKVLDSFFDPLNKEEIQYWLGTIGK